MHILPPLETVKDIAATQQYDVLPLSCEILSDFITPIEAMRILKNVSTHCYMLESAQADDRWGRYTFISNTASRASAAASRTRTASRMSI